MIPLLNRTLYIRSVGSDWALFPGYELHFQCGAPPDVTPPPQLRPQVPGYLNHMCWSADVAEECFPAERGHLVGTWCCVLPEAQKAQEVRLYLGAPHLYGAELSVWEYLNGTDNLRSLDWRALDNGVMVRATFTEGWVGVIMLEAAEVQPTSSYYSSFHYVTSTLSSALPAVDKLFTPIGTGNRTHLEGRSGKQSLSLHEVPEEMVFIMQCNEGESVQVALDKAALSDEGSILTIAELFEFASPRVEWDPRRRSWPAVVTLPTPSVGVIINFQAAHRPISRVEVSFRWQCGTTPELKRIRTHDELSVCGTVDESNARHGDVDYVHPYGVPLHDRHCWVMHCAAGEHLWIRWESVNVGDSSLYVRDGNGDYLRNYAGTGPMNGTYSEGSVADQIGPLFDGKAVVSIKTRSYVEVFPGMKFSWQCGAALPALPAPTSPVTGVGCMRSRAMGNSLAQWGSLQGTDCVTVDACSADEIVGIHFDEYNTDPVHTTDSGSLVIEVWAARGLQATHLLDVLNTSAHGTWPWQRMWSVSNTAAGGSLILRVVATSTKDGSFGFTARRQCVARVGEVRSVEAGSYPLCRNILSPTLVRGPGPKYELLEMPREHKQDALCFPFQCRNSTQRMSIRLINMRMVSEYAQAQVVQPNVFDPPTVLWSAAQNAQEARPQKVFMSGDFGTVRLLPHHLLSDVPGNQDSTVWVNAECFDSDTHTATPSLPLSEAPVTPAPPTRVPAQPTAMPTPAPMALRYPLWCKADSDCRLFGDTEATCAQGRCDCSSGYLHPAHRTNPSLKAYTCVPEAREADGVLRIVFQLDGPCDVTIWSTGLQEVAAVVQAMLLHSSSTAAEVSSTVCGGGVDDGKGAFVVEVSLTGANMYAGVLMPPEVMTAQYIEHQAEQNPQTTLGRLVPASVALEWLQRMNGCTGEHALAADLRDGACVMLACTAGHTVAADTFACVNTDVPLTTAPSPPSPTTSSDDDALSDGAIAGIVVGSVVGAALLVAAAVYLCRQGGKPNLGKPPAQTSEPVENA